MQNQGGSPNDQQQGSRDLEDRNNPAIQLAESLKGIKNIENAKEGDKSVPEQMAPDKANSTILMLGAMALLIAGAMALPAGAVAFPFLGIMAGVAGAMGVKNMADMAGITPGKGNKRKIDNKLDDAKLEAIDNAINELKRNSHQGSSQSQDLSQSLKSKASTLQNPRESIYKPELESVLKALADEFRVKQQPQAQFDRTVLAEQGENPRSQPSQSLRQGGNSLLTTGWSGGGGADVVGQYKEVGPRRIPAVREIQGDGARPLGFRSGAQGGPGRPHGVGLRGAGGPGPGGGRGGGRL